MSTVFTSDWLVQRLDLYFATMGIDNHLGPIRSEEAEHDVFVAGDFSGLAPSTCQITSRLFRCGHEPVVWTQNYFVLVPLRALTGTRPTIRSSASTHEKTVGLVPAQ